MSGAAPRCGIGQLAGVLLIWVLAAPVAAATPLEGVARSVAEDLHAKLGVAASVAVRDRDGSIGAWASGSSPEGFEPVVELTTDTGMPGGSTGKTFVAATVMLLVEDGLLGLDDSVADWLGAYDWYERLPNHDIMRIRHLLTHTAGIEDHVDSLRHQLAVVWQLWREGSALLSAEEQIAYVLDEPPLGAPGEHYRYSDTGYLLLGLVIEAATGRDYYELLEERILEPRRLDEVRPQTDPAMANVMIGEIHGTFLTTITGFAGPTHVDGRFRLHPRIEWTGGGLVTTPTMLVRFYSDLAEGRVVSPESFELMRDSGLKGPEPGRYGFGLYVAQSDALGMGIGHGGWFPGYRTAVTYFPEYGVAVALQINSDTPELESARYVREAAQAVLAVAP